MVNKFKQWGTGTITSTGSGQTVNGFTLPLAFSSTHLGGVAGYAGNGPQLGTIAGALTYQPESTSRVDIGVNTSTAIALAIRYVAVGK